MRLSPVAVVVFSSACGPKTEDASSDADGDGFTHDQGDCDDADPEVHPDAADLPYDAIDQDCDPSDGSTFYLTRVEESEGSNLGGPRFASLEAEVRVNVAVGNDLGRSAWVSTTYDGTTGEEQDVSHDVIDDGDGDVIVQLGPTIDAALRPGGLVLGAASILTSTGGLRISLVQLPQDADWSWQGWGPSASGAHFDHVAMSDDGEHLALVGCGSSGIRYLSGAVSDFDEATYTHADSPDDTISCEAQGAEVRSLGEDGILKVRTPGSGGLPPTGESWEEVVDFAWEPEGMLLVRKGGLTLETGSETIEIPTSQSPVRARFDVAPDGESFIAYATRQGDLYLLYGPLGEPLTEVLVDTGVAKSDLDVEVTDHAVFVGARTGDDAWVATALRADGS